MPLAKIHVLEGRYDERRLGNVSKAVQEALISALRIPPDDFFQIIHVLPRDRFLHTPSFLGLKYSDDFIVLELAFISAGRPHDPARRGSGRELLLRPGIGATRARLTGGLRPPCLICTLIYPAPIPPR